MAALIDLDIVTSGVDEQTTGFSVRINDGPVVQASLTADLWVFSFKGKNNDDNLRLALDYQEARIFAFALAQRLSELEPGRQAYELQRKALSMWLKTLVQDLDEAGAL